MGYRLNVNNVNALGHLIEGNISTYIDQIFFDENNLAGTIDYFDRFFSSESNDFISSNPIEFVGRTGILKNQWNEIKSILYEFGRFSNKFEDVESNNRRLILLRYFQKLSILLGRYKYKFLILPGFDDNIFNRRLIEEDSLRRWLTNSSYFSYLIIQLKEQPQKDNLQIFNSFYHYEKALDRIDEWPGIIVWEDIRFSPNNLKSTRGIFIPLNNEKDLNNIFERLSYERNFLNSLISIYGERKKRNTAEIIHLSDLHLGTRQDDTKINRLLKILEKQTSNSRSKYEPIALITGDLVDSPSKKNEKKYKNFELSLSLMGYDKNIHVLGNHDYNAFGFLTTSRASKNNIHNLSNNSLEIFKKLKLIVIKFNSNIDGNLAQGKIGNDQLADIGNQLDSIKNLNSYCIIAMLHHHPFELQRPDWIKRKWYERILGDNFMNSSLRLTDSDIFVEWLNNRGIKFVIHGHKHIPMLFEVNGINVISAGSSTGAITHIDQDKTFLTYNIITYDINKKKPTSTVTIYEDLMGSGTKHYQIMKY